MKEYHVMFTDKTEKEFNQISDAYFFEKANCMSDFCSPWDNNPFSKIEFRALWNTDHLFFNFTVFDTDIYIDLKDDSVDSIGNSDRVELFFRVNDTLNPYYCLEMDTNARLMDFKARPNWNFDFDWKWPKSDFDLKATRNKNGFIVEGRISMQSLKELNLLQDNILEVGVYRAKFSKDENQNYSPTWISWVNPNTETPNFHTATSFGKFKLVK